MMTLLVFKEHLREFYNKYEVYITPVYKFLSTFIILTILNQHIGFMSQLKQSGVVLSISLLSAIIPQSLTVLIICLVMLMHIFTLSLELALVLAVILIMMYILYLRFVPKEALVVFWLPVLAFLKIPYVMPIVMGLVGTPLSIVSVAFGTVLYFIMNYVGSNTAVINNVAASESVQKINTLVNGLMDNAMLPLTLLTFSLVVVVVYVIRRMSVDHSWRIAIITGTVINMVVMLVGNLKLDLTQQNPVSWIVAGNLISMLLAFLLQFFVLSLDYSCTEHAQFEDDEYYYYVKAVPKITVTAPQVKVKRINAQKTKVQKRKANTMEKR